MKHSQAIALFESVSRFLSLVLALLCLTLAQWAAVKNDAVSTLLIIHIAVFAIAVGGLRLLTGRFKPDYHCYPEKIYWQGMTSFAVEADSVLWQSIGVGLIFGIPVVTGQVAAVDASGSSFLAWVLIPLTSINYYMTWWFARRVLWLGLIALPFCY